MWLLWRLGFWLLDQSNVQVDALERLRSMRIGASQHGSPAGLPALQIPARDLSKKPLALFAHTNATLLTLAGVAVFLLGFATALCTLVLSITTFVVFLFAATS